MPVACLPRAIDVPIYPTLTPPQVRYILKDSGARVLVVQNEEKFLQIREILAECPAVEHLVFFEKPAGRRYHRAFHWRNLKNAAQALAETAA